MIPSPASSIILLAALAVLALVLPLPLLLGAGLLVVLGFAIDMAALRRQVPVLPAGQEG